MAYIEVDIDLDDFDFEDLLDALKYKLKHASEKQKEEFKVLIKDLNEEINNKILIGYKIKTVTDQLKHELLTELYFNNSLEQLQNLINK